MVDRWSVETVIEWLDGEGLGKYKDKFIENAVDGACLLELTQADIKAELEIPVLQDRKDLWAALQRLKDGNPNLPQPTPAPAPETPSHPPYPPHPQPSSATGASPRDPRPRSPRPPSPLYPPSLSARNPNGLHSSSSSYAYTETRRTSASGLSNGQEHPTVPQPPGVCGRCARPIGAAFVRAFDRTWHEECFQCANCGRPIRDSKYAKRGLEPYHADCLALQQGDICSKCLTTITGVVTTALDRKWHLECFTCGTCGRPITDQAFAAVGDVPYHSACEPLEPSPLASSSPGVPLNYPVASQACAGCGGPIDRGVTTTALGKTWHSECFICAKCERPIREDKFKTDKGTPYHINCKLGESSIFCRGCRQEIHGGDIVNAMDEVWHPECFRCHRCGIRIMSEKFSRDGTRPIHTHCKHLL